MAKKKSTKKTARSSRNSSTSRSRSSSDGTSGASRNRKRTASGGSTKKQATRSSRNQPTNRAAAGDPSTGGKTSASGTGKKKAAQSKDRGTGSQRHTSSSGSSASRSGGSKKTTAKRSTKKTATKKAASKKAASKKTAAKSGGAKKSAAKGGDSAGGKQGSSRKHTQPPTNHSGEERSSDTAREAPASKPEPAPPIQAQRSQPEPADPASSNGDHQHLSDEELRKVKTDITKKDLKEFQALLLEKRGEITGDIDTMEAARAAARGGELSHMPLHMADVGSDAYEEEFTLGLMESERQLLREIDEALLRIENGTYGVCLESGKPINKARLEVAPWAKYCIEVAREREKRHP